MTHCPTTNQECEHACDHGGWCELARQRHFDQAPRPKAGVPSLTAAVEAATGGLNNLVAERVMGWRRARVVDAPRVPRPDGGSEQVRSILLDPAGQVARVLDYAGDIGAAMTVADHLRSLGWRMTLRQIPPFQGNEWECELEHSTPRGVLAAAPTAELAICLAALRAVEDHPA